MRKQIFYIVWMACVGMGMLPGCKEEQKLEQPPAETPSEGTGEMVYLDGYARPDGVLILNQGAPAIENSSITYLTPDGKIEEGVYRKVNGTALGNGAQDLWMDNGKLYILSNGVYTFGGDEGDGCLVIADAVTLKREKTYKLDDLKFKRPEGSLDKDEWISLSVPFENIAVLDERNIFFAEGQGFFRLDGTTGEVNVVEGAYHFGNKGNTVEAVAIPRGILRVGDCLYCGGGGFWESTRLLEFSKGMNKVSRVLPDLKGEFISGLFQTGEREIVLATCGRKGEKNSYLQFVDLDQWKVTKSKKISEDISAEFFNTSGVTLAGDYLYYAAGSTTIKRLSLKTWKSEEFINVLNDAPEGKYLNCNVIADPTNQYVYVAVSNVYRENVKPDKNYLLVYDCSGNTPSLVQKVENQTNYPIGIYPMRKFYHK